MTKVAKDTSFTGGTVVGVLSAPEAHPAPKKRRKRSTPVPQENVRTEGGDILTCDSDETIAMFEHLVVGAIFLRQFRVNQYLCYTKKSETDMPADYRVILFKRLVASAIKEPYRHLYAVG